MRMVWLDDADLEFGTLVGLQAALPHIGRVQTPKGFGNA
jgi:hypothetical protein